MTATSNRIRFLNTYMDSLTAAEAAAEVERLVDGGGRHYAVTPNSDIVVKMQDDPELKAVCEAADLILCDGMVLVRISERCGEPIRERVCMTDFVWDVGRLARRRGWGVFMLGGRPEVLERARTRLESELPGLTVSGHCSPPLGFESDEGQYRDVLRQVNESGARILLVFLGCPKQEKFIARALPDLDVNMAFPMGGCVDFLAGEVRRAPRWMQEHSLEWLYRFLQEPKRMFRRYFVDDMRIFALARKCGRRDEKSKVKELFEEQK